MTSILYWFIKKLPIRGFRISRTYIFENDDEFKKNKTKIKVSSICVFIDKSVNKILFVQPSLFRERKFVSSRPKCITAVRAFWRK